MARGKGRDKRQDLKAKEKPEENEEETEQGGVTEEVYLQTASDYRTEQSVSDESRGKQGSIVKFFEERGGNKKAFKTVNWLKKQEPAKRDDFFRSLVQYGVWEGVIDKELAAAPAPEPDLVDKAAPEVPGIPKGAAAH